jgi:ureidoacrylate peracid hydrolase
MEPHVTTESLAARTRSWLDSIAAVNEHAMRLRPDRVALLVIDMQTFFLDPSSPTFTCGGLAVLPTVQALIGAFRNTGRPVIYTRHVHHPDGHDAGIMGWWWEGMCREGTPESEVHPSLAPRPSEKVVLKHRYSAFYNTDLETVLRCLKIEDVVIAGIMTNLCCESTARDAYMRDHRVFFLADGTGTVSEDMHLASLRNLAFGFAYVTTAKDIIEQLHASLDT